MLIGPHTGEKSEHEFAFDIYVNGVEAGKRSLGKSILNNNGCV